MGLGESWGGRWSCACGLRVCVSGAFPWPTGRGTCAACVFALFCGLLTKGGEGEERGGALSVGFAFLRLWAQWALVGLCSVSCWRLSLLSFHGLPAVVPSGLVLWVVIGPRWPICCFALCVFFSCPATFPQSTDCGTFSGGPRGGKRGGIPSLDEWTTGRMTGPIW